jgi:hypothetical protein
MELYLEVQSEQIKNQELPKEVKIKENIFWDNSQMIFYSFSLEPTYLLLSNSFSFDRNVEETTEGKIAYSKYLTSNEIKTLSYFDYSGEKIHRLIKFDGDDFEKIKPNDLQLVTSKLLIYLDENKLKYEHEKTIAELNILNKLANIFLNSENYFLVFAG